MMPASQAVSAEAVAAGDATRNVFPLPLDPFERYMLGDDRRTYPMTFVMLYQFDGLLQRELLEQAWRQVVARHPLARATVDRHGSRAQWQLDETKPTAAIDFSDQRLDGRPGSLGSWLDLTTTPGLRAAVRQAEGRSCLLVEHHHAAFDGVAALQFAGEVLLAYDALWRQAPVELPELDNARLMARCQPDVAPPPSPTPWRDRWFAIREAARFGWQRPTPLVPPVAAAARGGFVAPQLCRLSTAHNQTLRSAAGAAGATFNDMLLAATFIALDRWNSEQGDRRSHRMVRVNMPTNLRERADAVLPAANAMSFTFLTRRRALCRQPGELLASIVAETQLIKRYRLGRLFLGALSTIAAVPGALPWVVSERACFATAVLSNVGQLARRLSPRLRTEAGLVRVGDLTLEQTGGTPPLRPNTHLSMAVCQYGGGATLWLRTDPRRFDAAATVRLATLLVEGLEVLVGAPPGSWHEAVAADAGLSGV